MGIERIKACLNGSRRRDEHPRVPITAGELAVAAADAVAAGAEALHLHPRGRAGAQSLHFSDVGAAVSAVRRACPGVPVGVTTGLWISGGDAARRLAAVARCGLAATALITGSTGPADRAADGRPSAPRRELLLGQDVVWISVR